MTPHTIGSPTNENRGHPYQGRRGVYRLVDKRWPRFYRNPPPPRKNNSDVQGGPLCKG